MTWVAGSSTPKMVMQSFFCITAQVSICDSFMHANYACCEGIIYWDIWPAPGDLVPRPRQSSTFTPLGGGEAVTGMNGIDDLIAAPERSDRIRQIRLLSLSESLMRPSIGQGLVGFIRPCAPAPRQLGTMP
jgi:hypothetical protein